MIATTLVSLYTARITLQVLGSEDFGIFNVVGGIIGFMGILTGTLNNASLRYLAVDLGKKDIVSYKKTFSMLLNIFLFFALVSVFFLEIIGPIVIDKYLVLPGERVYAAQVIFQFTILNFVMNTLIIPYVSSIITYEKMGIFAYFTFLDVVLKLIIVYFIAISPYDKLITYGALFLFSTFLHALVNVIYCKFKIEGCSYTLFWDKKQFKNMVGFSGWNLFASATNVMNHQGQSILLNIFFGPLINAAKAIADKINSVINSFVTNFYTAVGPQLIKSYANNEFEYTKTLVLKSSKYAFFLLFVLTVPLLCNMNELLYLWLGKETVSEEMVIFSKLVLVYSLVASLEYPLSQVVRATGNVKRYQINVGIQTLSFIPICYLLFRIGYPAYYSMILLTLIYFFATFYRVYHIRNIIGLSMREYVHRVLLPILYVIIPITCLLYLFNFSVNGFLQLVYYSTIELLFTIITIYFVGLQRPEKEVILRYMNRKISKNNKK